MSIPEGARRAGPDGPRSIEIRIAAQLENLPVLRTMVGCVGAFEDLDLDAVADLRLAVDEACTRLIRSAAPDATLVVVVDPREGEVVIDVSTTATGPGSELLTQGSFSWHVLTALTDEVRSFHDVDGTGPIVGISMLTRRTGSVR